MRAHPSLASSVALVTWLVAGSASCRRAESDEASPQATVSVRTAVVEPKPFVETVGAIGSIVPQAGHFAALGAPGPTRVARVLVTSGQRVARGQVLIELDQTAFRASAEGAQAALRAAEQAYERAQRLAQEGVGPRKDVEQAAADLARARSEAVTANRSAQLAVLRAPIGGVVTRVGVALGASVDGSQTLVEIADPGALDLLLAVTPEQAARIKVGAAVELAAGQAAGGESLGTGKVFDVAGVVDSTSRSVEVRVRVGSTPRPLRIGETVQGRIVVGTRPSALTVPLEALVPEGDKFKVFVVDADGVAHSREVEVGARADSTAEISKGLVAGERVVTYGAYGVTDSAKVVTAAPAGGKR
jgi:membrane fusion protein (multidrug efflux system)